MGRINLTLSLEVVEAADKLANLLKVSRADVISFYLEGSTYLKRARLPKSNFLCPKGSTNPRRS